MESAKRILIVEDERDLAEVLGYNLRRAGYATEVVHEGAAGLSAARQQSPDLVILDVMLPKMSGYDVARGLRNDPTTSSIPILMLTARVGEADQVTGLSAGADDYVTKPFSMKVLLARVEALLRRAPRSEGGAVRLSAGLIEADLGSHVVTVDGQVAKLTLTEFKLLTALMGAPQRVLSRNELISRVMGPGVVVTSRTIDVHVAALRKKLGEQGAFIHTIRGVGYQLTTPAATPAR